MKNVFTIERQIKSCTTARQVKALLDKNKIYYRDATKELFEFLDAPETKALNLWLDNSTRIYFASHGCYSIQKWIKFDNSGAVLPDRSVHQEIEMDT